MSQYFAGRPVSYPKSIRSPSGWREEYFCDVDSALSLNLAATHFGLPFLCLFVLHQVSMILIISSLRTLIANVCTLHGDAMCVEDHVATVCTDGASAWIAGQRFAHI